MSCCRRSASMPNSAAWCPRSPPAPMSRRSITSSPRRWPKRSVSFTALDGVAAAAGPGLIGGVIVGLTTAKAIALAHDKPLIAVNHLEAHALTARLTDATAISLLPVSRLRRPHPNSRRARRRRLSAARRHGRRRHRRSLRQDRQIARPRLSGRSAGREGGDARRPEALRAAAADERPPATPIFRCRGSRPRCGSRRKRSRR